MTREEFVKKYRPLLACGFIYGAVSEIKDGPLVRSGKLMDIPETVESLLRDMVADIFLIIESAKREKPPMASTQSKEKR